MDKRRAETFHQRRNMRVRATLGTWPADTAHLLGGFQNHTQSHNCFSMFNSHLLESEITRNRKYQEASHTPSHEELFCEHISRVCVKAKDRNRLFS